ncbi:MAG TPA: di-heme oxidoredictase family protein [Blastocatellia bacterium]|nr:di-heme oxidoredictase family protein [Blastocatellia bacterium]
MKSFKFFALVFYVASIVLPACIAGAARTQAGSEAATGFDDLTNGLVDQATFDSDRARFSLRNEIRHGLGPGFNATACVECHQNPQVGGGSQVTVLRAGRVDRNGSFIEPPGGTLIHDRAIHPAVQERVPGGFDIRALRISLSLLGTGYVEAIDDNTLIAIANSQPAAMRGEVVFVPVLESPGTMRVGRFGWKNQHASLLSFSADAYLIEMGITNRLLPSEQTSLGRSVAEYDNVADPEDSDNDIDAFARFMRATKAPPQDEALAATDEARAGSQLFDKIGCGVCHVRSIETAAEGSLINGGAFAVPPALAGKTIHPFSDFLLHNVGTGDGIYQAGNLSTRNKLRTPPLWGLRTRGRLMHDGATLSVNEAILRHGGEASGVIEKYRAMSRKKRDSLIAFLNSL